MELVLKYGFGLPESQVTRLSDYTDNHFDGIAGLMRRFPRRFKIEFILGDAFDVMERIRLGISDRPASFPRSFDHIWLSNCPDYVGCVLCSAARKARPTTAPSQRQLPPDDPDQPTQALVDVLYDLLQPA